MSRTNRPLPTASRSHRSFPMKSLTLLLAASLAVPNSSFVVDSRRTSNIATTAGGSRSTSLRKASESSSEEPDLFEYFDPLLSPHAYPNGISPDSKPEPPDSNERRFNPPGFDPFGINEKTGVATTKVKEERPVVDPTAVFDPTLSPHAYPNGVPDIVVGDPDAPEPKVVGVLLMDHGSRNPAANERLIKLAELYQETMGSSTVIVRAAHMEIATPSIPDGLRSLLEAGVDEIVCHPYFLSPGRHVVEDIPEIVQSAIETLEIEIPITTTDPVGSKTDVMIGAIHSLVTESSVLMK